jgi:hypothetical protein
MHHLATNALTMNAARMNDAPQHPVGRPQTDAKSARATDALRACACPWDPPPSLFVWPSQALMGVEWDTLLFFAALFVVVEGVSEMGLLRFIANTLSVFDPALPPAAAAVAQTVSCTSSISSTRRRQVRWGWGLVA